MTTYIGQLPASIRDILSQSTADTVADTVSIDTNGFCQQGYGVWRQLKVFFVLLLAIAHYCSGKERDITLAIVLIGLAMMTRQRFDCLSK